MYRFLAPLLAGFVLAGASAFTAALSRRWGERGGRMATSVLRNLLGIPLYFIGLVLAWQAPAPLLFDTGTPARALAWGLIVAGSLPVVVGHVQLGWRTHMPSMRDTLFTGGLYARIRHPIYAGGLAIFIGLALLRPTTAFVLACALSCVFLVVQARLEEIDLIERRPEYRDYMRAVPAFFPRLSITPPGTRHGSPWAHWWWLCPSLSVLLAGAILYVWGLTWWTALVAALLQVCPVMIVWGLVHLDRKP